MGGLKILIKGFKYDYFFDHTRWYLTWFRYKKINTNVTLKNLIHF